MKAMLSISAGGPETLSLTEVPKPETGPGQVRIAVKACAVNFPDVLIIQDLYQMKPPRPFAPGQDIAGVVDAIGDSVSELRVGDRVAAGVLVSGGMAEFAVAAADQCFKVPDSVGFDQAAALLMTYGTSHYALKRRAQLQRGETLLVLGAAGGVGLAAVELGKAMGARVVAAVSSPDKAALVRAEGADEVVIYGRGPFDKAGSKALAEQFKTACGANGANVIYDAVGGDYAEPALRSIAWEGRYLVVGFPAGIPKIALNIPLLKSCQIIGVFYGAAIAREPHAYREQINELFAMCARGAINPIVSERFPLERAGDAIARLATREAKGKVIVTID